MHARKTDDSTDNDVTPAPLPLPGDITPAEYLQRVIRVNQAGEYGARRIYQGQLDVLRRKQDRDSRKSVPLIEHMAEQEEVHLDTFNRMMVERQVRPTALAPFWHVAGYMLGAGTAMMGPKAAMACTVAVESVIDQHYAHQLDTIDKEAEPELHAKITRFREEEMEHHNTGLQEGAADTPLYGVLSEGIKAASRLAIFLSKRV